MRVESLSLRILILSALLATTAGACVLVLVSVGVLRLNGGQVVGAGGALLLIAVLAAAVSALGPKYRPTPLLTPISAGIFAALLATTAVYAAHSQIAPKSRAAVAAREVKVKPVTRPVKTAPVVAIAPTEPEPLPEPKAVRLLDPGFDVGASAPVPQGTQVPPPNAAPAAVAAVAAVQDDIAPAPAAVPAPRAAAPGRAGSPAKTAAVPLPAAAPATDPDAPINLQATFDVSAPVQPKAGPPLALATIVDEPSATPPRPRIRPCGGAAPACP